MDQFEKIIQVCGNPDQDLLTKIEQQSSVSVRQLIEKSTPYPRRDLFDYLKSKGADFSDVNIYTKVQNRLAVIDFLDRILVLDPDRRFGGLKMA